MKEVDAQQAQSETESGGRIVSLREHCECGCDSLLVEFDPRRHAYRHREWAQGIQLAKTVAPEFNDGILHVTPESPMGERKLAYRMACVAQRTHQWDFPTFPYPARCPDAEAPDAFLYLKDRRVIGYLVVKISPALIPADMKKLPRCFSTDHLWPQRVDNAEFREQSTRCVSEVFISANFRRSGIGTAL